MKFWKKSKISQLKVDWWFLGLEVRWWWKGFISWLWCYLSVQFNHSVVSDSATPWTAACRASLSITNSWSLPNSCPLSWWGNPSISSSVIPFSSHPQSFPASGSVPMNQFFASGGQCIEASASASVQLSSVSQSCTTLCDPMDFSTLGFPVHHQLLEFTKLTSIELVMPSNHLILCCPLLLLSSIFPSIRVFSNESAPHIRWPKYWSFSFNISLSSEYSGLISFRMNW